jgi:predicted permease
MKVDLSEVNYPDRERRAAFFDEVIRRVRALPGVQSAAVAGNLPLTYNGDSMTISVEGVPDPALGQRPDVIYRVIGPGYFGTMGIPMVSGRDFSLADAAGEKAVAVVSRSMANLFWPGENPLGKRFRISFTPKVVREVVGVVEDIRDRGLKILEPVTMLYLPILQSDTNAISLVVRGDGDATRLTPGITRVLGEIAPELPVRNIRTMEEIVASTLSQQRYSMWLFAALAGLDFLLASVGIYSVLAYSIRNRVTEISIRMALGARPAGILRLVITEGMRPTLIGMLLGAFGAYALGGLLSKLIYGVSPTDPLTFLAVVLLLAAVALLACMIPAYRATRIEPVRALRGE